MGRHETCEAAVGSIEELPVRLHDRLRSRSAFLLSDEKTKTLRRRKLGYSGTKEIGVIAERGY
jgi:hypothetical protein